VTIELERGGVHHAALVDFLFQVADDELIVGHRNSEWLGVAPDVEEDVAFASIAQDEIGHASFYYSLLEELGQGSADALAFARDANERRNATAVEQENGNWAVTIVRQYFYNAFDMIRLRALEHSSYEPLANGAAKMVREEYYHALHMETWFKRLATGSEESARRIRTAVAEIWNELPDLFDLGQYATDLRATGVIAMDAATLYETWCQQLRPVFSEIGIAWPGEFKHAKPVQRGRIGQHTPALVRAIATMCEVYRIEPGVHW